MCCYIQYCVPIFPHKNKSRPFFYDDDDDDDDDDNDDDDDDDDDDGDDDEGRSLRLFPYGRTKHRINIHLFNHCPTSKGVSEVSKQANE